jgi:hypothetical protein
VSADCIDLDQIADREISREQALALVSDVYIDVDQIADPRSDLSEISREQALALASPVLKRSRSPSPPTAEALEEVGLFRHAAFGYGAQILKRTLHIYLYIVIH